MITYRDKSSGKYISHQEASRRELDGERTVKVIDVHFKWENKYEKRASELVRLADLERNVDYSKQEFIELDLDEGETSS